MQQVVIPRAGGYERLRLEERPAPAPGPGAVLVAVEAAGVNYADCAVRMGVYRSAKHYVGWPITPGFEVAGRVAAVGEGVTDLAPGARVIAVTRFGGYASQVVVPRAQVFGLPPGWTAAQGATFPAVFLTAYYALFELAHPRPGQRLLVHSAAGGVGGALLQLARVAGCEAVGVVTGAHKVEPARRQGAVAVIDKAREDLWAAARRHAPEGYHVVLDANGAETLRASYAHLAPTGKLVAYGFASMLPRGGGRVSWPRLAWTWLKTPRFDPLQMTTDNKSVLCFNLSYLFEETPLLSECMTRLLGWVAEGRLSPLDVTTYPLERVADAHRDLEGGATTGKLALVPAGTPAEEPAP